MPADPTTEPHWWDAPAMAFDAWLAAQPIEVQELTLLEQIEVYAAGWMEAANAR